MKFNNNVAIALLILGLVCSASADSFDEGVSTFAADLYGEVTSAASGDFIISPFSAQTVLSIALQGAIGLTAAQMISGLQFDGSTQFEIAQSYQTALAPLQNNPLMKTANKIYLQNGYNTTANFNNIITQDFYTSAESVDFAQSNSTANEINSWVSNETDYLINNLISPSALTAATKMVLVNAIYFKGTWTKAFNTANTYGAIFNTDPSTSATIPFMHITDTFKYAQLSAIDAQVIELTYVNSTMSMIVILPNDVNGITSLESTLNTIDFQTLSSQLISQKVVVSLPKFTTSFSVTLNNALSNLGMTNMFTDAANFSNMLQQPGGLKISSVVQKAYIEVNEQGATAAAATGVIITTALAHPVAPVIQFNANHPFIYFLQEDNKYPYFIGRFMNAE